MVPWSPGILEEGGNSLEEQNKKGKVKAFRDLRIYQEARHLSSQIYELTKRPSFSKDYGLVNQIRQASVSIMSNIAEGFERNNNKEFIMFLHIARGSCGEVSAQLDVALDQNYIDRKTHEDLTGECRRLGAMMNKLIVYLKASDFKGLKHRQTE